MRAADQRVVLRTIPVCRQCALCVRPLARYCSNSCSISSVLRRRAMPLVSAASGRTSRWLRQTLTLNCASETSSSVRKVALETRFRSPNICWIWMIRAVWLIDVLSLDGPGVGHQKAGVLHISVHSTTA